MRLTWHMMVRGSRWPVICTVLLHAKLSETSFSLWHIFLITILHVFNLEKHKESELNRPTVFYDLINISNTNTCLLFEEQHISVEYMDIHRNAPHLSMILLHLKHVLIRFNTSHKNNLMSLYETHYTQGLARGAKMNFKTEPSDHTYYKQRRNIWYCIYTHKYERHHSYHEGLTDRLSPFFSRCAKDSSPV